MDDAAGGNAATESAMTAQGMNLVAARELYDIYEQFVTAGFDDEQAFLLVQTILASTLEG
jgi:hypothetical protein